MENSGAGTLFDRLRTIFEEKIPFNRILGLRVVSLDYNRPVLGFQMKESLVGNYVRGSIHGGVLSSVADVAGGLAAFLGLQQRLEDLSLEERLAQFSRLATIDLRMDFLRPGSGPAFEVLGYTLRTGKRIAVTRIEIRETGDRLIAVGTGTYVVQ